MRHESVGFVYNPYTFMARAWVHSVISMYEGDPNVLLESPACVALSISADRPSGPREVLIASAVKELVPMGDRSVLTEVMMRY
jgi:hypothetical protein